MDSRLADPHPNQVPDPLDPRTRSATASRSSHSTQRRASDGRFCEHVSRRPLPDDVCRLPVQTAAKTYPVRLRLGSSTGPDRVDRARYSRSRRPPRPAAGEQVPVDSSPTPTGKLLMTLTYRRRGGLRLYASAPRTPSPDPGARSVRLGAEGSSRDSRAADDGSSALARFAARFVVGLSCYVPSHDLFGEGGEHGRRLDPRPGARSICRAPAGSSSIPPTASSATAISSASRSRAIRPGHSALRHLCGSPDDELGMKVQVNVTRDVEAAAPIG